MTDFDKHRSRFKGRKKENDGRRKYSEFKRRQYESLGEKDTSKSVGPSPSEEADEDLLEAFLRDMQSSGEPGELDLPEISDVFGNDVFTLTWDAGGTNNGTWSVVTIGQYFFCDVSSGTFGPFSTLVDALEWSEMTTVTSVTESINSSDLTASEVAELLSATEEVEQGFQLQINNETWELNWRGNWSRSKARN